MGSGGLAVSRAQFPGRISLEERCLHARHFPAWETAWLSQTSKYDLNIWRVDLKGPGQKPGQPSRFISSTRIEIPGLFTRRSENRLYVGTIRADEIWICDSDGSQALQLTSFGGSAIYCPNWSPDSQNIAFTVDRKE